MTAKWRQVSIPLSLIDRAEWLLEHFPDIGFQSTTEFVRSAVREKLEQLEDRVQRQREWKENLSRRL